MTRGSRFHIREWSGGYLYWSRWLKSHRMLSTRFWVLPHRGYLSAWAARKSLQRASAPPFPIPWTMYNYIVVEGPIGVGKTTLVQKLAEHFGAQTILEQAEENPFLPGFYKDPAKYAFSAQLFFLTSRYRQLKEADQVDLFRRRAVADYMLEKDLIFAQLNLESDEFKLYNEIYGLLLEKLARPDLVIFLSADTETLVRRIGKRGRPYESGISEKYIAEVNQAYHRWFFQYDRGPALQVNTNGLDFANSEGDFGKLLEKISHPVKGREFFNPLGSN